jgi:hypothetical protein
MYILGSKLSRSQQSQVLSAFVYRWTFENALQSYGGKCPACEQSKRIWHGDHAPLTTDAKWLAEYAFCFVSDGSRLSNRTKMAVPSYMAWQSATKVQVSHGGAWNRSVTAMPKYGIEGGRTITVDGVPSMYINIVRDAKTDRYAMVPADADDLARKIVDLLNGDVQVVSEHDWRAGHLPK